MSLGRRRRAFGYRVLTSVLSFPPFCASGSGRCPPPPGACDDAKWPLQQNNIAIAAILLCEVELMFDWTNVHNSKLLRGCRGCFSGDTHWIHSPVRHSCKMIASLFCICQNLHFSYYKNKSWPSKKKKKVSHLGFVRGIGIGHLLADCFGGEDLSWLSSSTVRVSYLVSCAS